MIVFLIHRHERFVFKIKQNIVKVLVIQLGLQSFPPRPPACTHSSPGGTCTNRRHGQQMR